MHTSVLNWVSFIVQEYKLAPLSTLEVGSLNVNGTIRGYFNGPYIGVDFREGPDVDKVMNAHALDFADESFDVVISTEMLEHDSAFWISLSEMGRVLKQGGYLIITTRGLCFAEHGHPYDYWRFLPSSAPIVAELANCNMEVYTSDPEAPGIFVLGIKR
jgi:SAM-dependent methyltransferase